MNPANDVAAGASTDRVNVLLCRGCCCGTNQKHPEVDHAAQAGILRAALPSGSPARLWEVDCLGPCERSNVVAVRRGSVRRWFGEVLDETTTDDLAAWIADGAPEALPSTLAARAFDPQEVEARTVVPLTVDALLDRVEADLRDAVGTWTMGVPGATAELAWDGDRPEVRRTGTDRRTIEAVGATGALRLTLHPDVVAFQLASILVLAVPRPAASPPPGLAIGGPDHQAIRAADRSARLVDLGIGHACASFEVRTGERGLLATLASMAGAPVAEMLERSGEVLLEASPDRIVRSPVGRCEVSGPIPRPGATSPDGPHTHLLPGPLALGHELPVGLALPKSLMPAATFYGPPGWEPTTPGRST